MNRKLLASAICILGSVSILPAFSMEFMNWSLPIEAQQKIKEADVEKMWKCVGCNPAEEYTLSYLQNKTSITDKYALATILGNIKQESMFLSNICEGGARVPYHQCHRGGYGLIQWTTSARYKGLGSFCNKYGCDPSSLEGQVRYMVNEAGFQNNLSYFERAGQTVNHYMNAAYRWLGWGIHGNRTAYAHEYLNKLTYT